MMSSFQKFDVEEEIGHQFVKGGKTYIFGIRSLNDGKIESIAEDAIVYSVSAKQCRFVERIKVLGVVEYAEH